MPLVCLRLLFVSLVFSGIAAAQPELKIPVHKLKQDFEIFRGALEESHAGIYWYRTKAEMDLYFQEAFRTIDRDMTELEFYTILTPLIVKIGCGHTWIATTEPTQNRIWETQGVLPLKLKFLQRKAFVIENNSVDSLTIMPGQEILSINGLSIDSLLKLSDRFSPGDGFVKTGKMKVLDNVFNQFYTLYIGQPKEYVVRVLAEGQPKDIVFQAMPLEKTQAISKHRYKRYVPEDENIGLKWKGHHTALLQINEFSDWQVDGRKVDFAARLKRTFQKIDSAEVRNLVIDLRDNDGGNEKYGLLLYSYLTDKSFTGYRQIDFRSTRLSYRKHSDIKWLSYMFLKAMLNHKKLNDTTYLLTNDKSTRIQQPQMHPFRGRIFVLIDRGTFSTASDFAAIAHDNKVATFIGEETGGGYAGNSSNYTYILTLPNSKIRVNIPIARYQNNVARQRDFGRGVVPDHFVKYSIDDIFSGADRDLETAMQLLER